jgi:hypothetical protein
MLNLTTGVKLFVEALFRADPTVDQFASANGNVSRQFVKSLANGVGLDQIDGAFSETRTIAASGDFTHDLSDLLDVFGRALALVRIKGIFVYADPGNTNNVNVFAFGGVNEFAAPLIIGGIVDDPITASISVPPGGVLALLAPTAAGWPVSTDVNFTLANSGSGTGVTFDLLLLGGTT